MRLLAILPALLVGAALALSNAGRGLVAVRYQRAKRRAADSPYFETEKECKSVLKVTAAELAKKYPDRYPWSEAANNTAKRPEKGSVVRIHR